MLTGFLVGMVLPVNSLLGASLITQEFTGNLSLVNSSPGIQNPAEESAYSGFIVYDDNGNLVDWELNLTELNLNFNPNSTVDDLTPTVDFQLASASDWDLRVDFGIAFDAPLYTLARNDSEIVFTETLGLVGVTTYADFNPTVSVSSDEDNNASVPESNNIWGLVLACGVGALALKRTVPNV
jgi:hypothetical protein